ncbi:DNA repair helicase RAD25 [Mucor velutinosus]|uniref:DNA repair helicase RAD25 n=1 Tax=Mucor velutinosus TaxID=708070 RepID=A0AAN7DMM2_9FUNG|nr:DNA repair helicase RAD25 [Mucor velutinosus]
MSSPPEPITDIDEIALNKKRGRAQSVEPAPLQELDSEHHASEDASSTTVSAPKKTKRDDEDSSTHSNNTTTVSTIRKNMKDMTTTDKNLAESASTATSISQDDEEVDDEPMAEQDNSLANKFGGGSKKQNGGGDDEDWGEFAQDDDEEEDTKKDHTATTKVEDKPKYTFGASSGFGTKGWAATHQTIPTPSKQPTFGGFGSSTSSISSGVGSSSGGFGGFKSSILSGSKESTSAPSFGSFAKATASPFATAAAAGNAFTSSSPSTTAAALQTDSSHNNTTTAAVEFVPKDNNSKNHADESNGNSSESDQEQTTSTPATFGEGAKVKVPGVVQQTQVTTGEEDEDTIYQTKAKLLVLDTTSGNWKERGVGTFRINMKEEEAKKVLQTRLVMRTDSVYRVILNLLLFQGMKVFIMQDKFVRFAGFETEVKEDGTSETKLVSFALKLSNPSIAKEVCEQIISCIPRSSSNGTGSDNDDSKA